MPVNFYIYKTKNLSSIIFLIKDDQSGHGEYLAHLREAITSYGTNVKKWHTLILF